MLGLLSSRTIKPNPISPQTFSLHHYHHNTQQPHSFVNGSTAASIWRVIVPAAAGGGDWRRDYLRPALQKGEGSWNVACDARPARWLHRLDLSYLMLGVCLCLAPLDWKDSNLRDCSPDYRVTGVLADGRCLFRAIAHGVCLQTGEEVPDENRQRELADNLRAQVVEELLKRRKEIEWVIEGDFDVYVKRIQQPYVWGGEPELLMASHVLKKLISVYMKHMNTGNLTKIATYGEEYQNDKHPINVLFHGYGHYELLETCSN